MSSAHGLGYMAYFYKNMEGVEMEIRSCMAGEHDVRRCTGSQGRVHNPSIYELIIKTMWLALSMDEKKQYYRPYISVSSFSKNRCDIEKKIQGYFRV